MCHHCATATALTATAGGDISLVSIFWWVVPRLREGNIQEQENDEKSHKDQDTGEDPASVTAPWCSAVVSVVSTRATSTLAIVTSVA